MSPILAACAGKGALIKRSFAKSPWRSNVGVGDTWSLAATRIAANNMQVRCEMVHAMWRVIVVETAFLVHLVFIMFLLLLLSKDK